MAQSTPSSISKGLAQLSNVPVSSLTFLETLLTQGGGREGARSHVQLSDIEPADYAYALVLLLQLRHTQSKQRETNAATQLDLYSSWSQIQASEDDVESLDQHLRDLLKMFLAGYRSDQDIDCLLWTSFPEEDENGSRTLRAVDFLVKPDAPEVLLRHSLIEAALDRRWKYGRSYSTPQLPLPSRFERIEATIATPWTLHFATMGMQLAYLGLLTYYLLFPPEQVTTPAVPRWYVPQYTRVTVFLAFLVSNALSSLASARPLLLATVVIFGCTLPTGPKPGDGFFEGLLVIFGLHILLLHLPGTPSLALILSPSTALPLSMFMVRNVANVLPAYGFFGPALVLSIALLSKSLEDPYLRIDEASLQQAMVMSIRPSPYQTRWALFFIAAVMCVLWLLSTFMASIIVPTFDRSETPVNIWDRYGEPIGKKARAIAILACTTYDTPYIFYPPFSLLYFVFIAPFEYGSRLLGSNGAWVQRWRMYLWRITVLPTLLPVFLLSKLLL